MVKKKVPHLVNSILMTADEEASVIKERDWLNGRKLTRIQPKKKPIIDKYWEQLMMVFEMYAGYGEP